MVITLKILMANFHIVVIKSKILTFDELLKMYPNMYINVDLKDAPDSYEGTVAPTKCMKILLIIRHKIAYL